MQHSLLSSFPFHLLGAKEKKKKNLKIRNKQKRPKINFLSLSLGKQTKKDTTTKPKIFTSTVTSSSS